jgi:hypothetical protein
MIKNSLLTGLLALLTLSPLMPYIQIVSLFNASIILDPPAQNVQRWDNAWTETFFGNGSPPFKTVIYSEPQVAWNGTNWVKYELKPIGNSSAILRTPTCTYVVRETSILLFDPNCTAFHVNGMEWDTEQYSLTLDKWLPKTIKNACIGYNSSHVWQKWKFTDDSERTLYISCDNKQTLTFVSNSSATYRLIWRFTNINATRIISQNGTFIELEEGYTLNSTDFHFSKLVFFNNERLSLSVHYREISQSRYVEFRLRSVESGFANVELVYGNWTLGINEALVIDPETETFSSEASLDGTIYKWGISYPPSNFAILQDFIYVGQRYIGSYYYVYRGYVSFDTSPIRDYVVITNATLRLKTSANHSTVDFVEKVMGGIQPICGSSLEVADWNCGTAEVASWPYSSYPGDNVYINITIPSGQINTEGRTQFELKSDREGTAPSNSEYPEYVIFYGAEFAGSEPQLEIAWLPNIEYVQGTYWYYWKHSSNKAAIMLFGGEAYLYPPKVRIRSIFLQDGDGAKERVINDLYSNGFDVLSPKRDARLPPEEEDYVEYTKDSDWIYNLIMWLLTEKVYDYVFLFGFSAGGVAAAYEIQKDYAYVYSGAVVASAPVDADGYSSDPIFQSAHTAHKVKTCTSFIVGINDTAMGNIYKQMAMYFNHTNAHKEWHKWDNGHDIFYHTCLTHPDETVSEALNSWFDRHSVVLRNPSFEERLRSVYGCAHWETDRPGWRELRGDVNKDAICDGQDYQIVKAAIPSMLGDPKWNPDADLNGDGVIDAQDLAIVMADILKVATRKDGSYSWYIEGGGGSGSCYVWQWLNHSVEILKGKVIKFEFWFKPETLPSDGFVEAMIYYKDWVGDRYMFGPRVYYNQTKWYNASVTMLWVLPESTTTIKVMIRWNPDFKAWIDNATLTILP